MVNFTGYLALGGAVFCLAGRVDARPSRAALAAYAAKYFPQDRALYKMTLGDPLAAKRVLARRAVAAAGVPKPGRPSKLFLSRCYALQLAWLRTAYGNHRLSRVKTLRWLARRPSYPGGMAYFAATLMYMHNGKVSEGVRCLVNGSGLIAGGIHILQHERDPSFAKLAAAIVARASSGPGAKPAAKRRSRRSMRFIRLTGSGFLKMMVFQQLPNAACKNYVKFFETHVGMQPTGNAYNTQPASFYQALAGRPGLQSWLVRFLLRGRHYGLAAETALSGHGRRVLALVRQYAASHPKQGAHLALVEQQIEATISGIRAMQKQLHVH